MSNLLVFLLLCMLLCLIIPQEDIVLLRHFGLVVSGIAFLYSIHLLGSNTTYGFFNLLWFDISAGDGLRMSFGVDAVSSFFILLTNFLLMLCFLSSFSSIKSQFKAFVFVLLLIDFFLVGLFSSLDLFLFYVCFESILIPMFVLIGIWGSRQRRIHAAIQFFFYTLLGSFFMLAAVSLIYAHTGTTNILLLNMCSLSPERQLLVWVCFFMAFSIKIPMFPFHIWLPEAHVEAPTVGSVILAGVLLKMGGYGFLRFVVPLLPIGNYFFTPFVFAISTLAVLYTSLTAIRQIDLKKIIAYASVSHMNFVVLGIFNYSTVGILGSIFLMLSHGIVSSGLFFCVGVLYDRYHTRLLRYFGGIAYFMPIFAVCFFILILSNFSFPGTSNFVGEVLVLGGFIFQNMFCTFFVLISIVFSVIYSVWLYNRLFFGSVNTHALLRFSDLSEREFWVLAPCVVLTIVLGICPNIVLHKLEWASLTFSFFRY
uniref:NADH-ubiquinone oxidoreductase chain 4 n=1 Tax=Balamuthia mandrillaris TaxID=66527 RepID=A0A0K1HRS6_9EUKA|nr:NADH dehydrogenase subunit 4 [Balamuthia mandrillaris]AKT94903.1 NADH dehydrogenase subunit 4 [Balamuthia mandrillaris]